MDVSLAEALITSVTHNFANDSTFIKTLETKLYFNTITHIMDDSKRPDVPIRMDMPGWSDTYGFYSKATTTHKRHHLLFNINGYYNRSLAEMTMYPTNSNEPLMFMLTWPDVRTKNVGFYAEDHIPLKNASLKLSTRLAYHSNTVADDFGLNSLKICLLYTSELPTTPYV